MVFSYVPRKNIGYAFLTLITHQLLSNSDKSAFENRGPDYSATEDFCFGGVNYKAFCSVLSLQGSTLYPQPAIFSDFLLLWNGEIYNHDSFDSDTQYLVKQLIACQGCADSIIDLFGHFRGPFAFILVQISRNRIFFGRDRYGRRSLVGNSDLSYLGSIASSEVCSTESLLSTFLV